MELFEPKPVSTSNAAEDEPRPCEVTSDRPVYADVVEPHIPLDVLKVNPRGEPLTWGATPLESSAEIYEQQREVSKKLESYYVRRLPRKIPHAIVDYVHSIGVQRAVHRADKNHTNFGYRQKHDIDGVGPEELGLYYRAISGHASPAELLYVQEKFGVSVIELASLTHPYGKRLEMLDEMRAAAEEAVVIFGGELQDSPEDVYEVKGCDVWLGIDITAPTQALLMTRTRPIGTLSYRLDGQDHTVKVSERLSFVLRLDEASGLDTSVARKVRSISYPKKNEHKNTDCDNETELWGQRVIRSAPELSAIAAELLDSKQHSLAIPVSTTILAKSETLEAMKTHKAARQHQRNFVANRALRSTGDMLVVGVPERSLGEKFASVLRKMYPR